MSTNAWKTARRASRRRTIAAYKTTVGCERCGYRVAAEALDLHHPDGSGGGRRRTKPPDLPIAHVLGLQVICANCHRIETHHLRQAV